MIRWLRPWRGGYGAAPRCVVDDHQGGPPRRFLLPSQPLLAPVTGGQREHDPSGRDVELFRRHFYSSGKGLGVEGSKGAELADGLTIEDGDYKLVKTRLSAFFATHRDSVLKTSGIKNLVIVGVQTPNYIRQTDFDAVALDYDKVAVIIDATAAAKLEIHLSLAGMGPDLGCCEQRTPPYLDLAVWEEGDLRPFHQSPYRGTQHPLDLQKELRWPEEVKEL